MAAIPQFSILYPTDTQTAVSSSLFVQLQQNIEAYVTQFLPLVGGALGGPVTFATGQQFAGSQVTVVNPTYPHRGYWKTLADHIADPTVHLTAGPPQAHAPTHSIGGSDPLYGDSVSVSLSSPNVSIKNYIDTAVAGASALATTSYAPASYYEIGGAQPLYGNLIAINSSNPSTNIQSYIGTQIVAALGGSFSLNPTFSTVTLSSTGTASLNFSGNLLVYAGGEALLSSNGTNTTVLSPSAGGLVTFGNTVSSSAFGTIGSVGYSTGSSYYGPTAANVNGALTVGSDIAVSRSASSAPTVGKIGFGGAGSSAYLSWNLDESSGFYLSQPLTVNGAINFLGGSAIVIDNLSLGPIPTTSSYGGVGVNASGGLVLGAKEGQSILIGSPNTNLSTITFGPSGSWAQFGPGTATFSGSAGVVVNNHLTANIGFFNTTLYSGSNPGSGWINLGNNPVVNGQLDFGMTYTNSFTFTGATSIYGVLSATGLALGSSTYGPTNATIVGGATAASLTATSAVTSPSLVVAGSGSVNVLSSSKISAASASVGVLSATAVNTTSLVCSGSATHGPLILTNVVQTSGGQIISNWRVLQSLFLGSTVGPASANANNFPVIAFPNYHGGKIEAFHITATNADSSTATTATIFKNGSSIGTVALTSSQITGLTTLGSPVVINQGDYVQAILTTLGTAAGISVSIDVSQYVY
jgi:hypothetical protein